MIAIGVDAGGTSTVAALSQNGTFVREARGPGANATTMGVDDAADAILRAIRAAASGAVPDAVYVGAAGAGRAQVAAALQALLSRAFPAARVVVGDDAAIALRSAIPEGPGAVVVAGTGSVAYADNEGVTARVGGLGYLLGDEGSAFAIGLAAVKLYGRVLDGRALRDETTDLAARALAASDRDELIGAVYAARFAPSTLAALAPSIIAFAGKGNRASTRIVQDAAKDIGDLLKAAVKAVGLADCSPRVALSGGLLRENSLLTFLIETRINGDIAGATVVRNADEPVRGALRLAQELPARQ
ncbi:MAG: N-acetylglucosamine kinase [Candidatus Velthaea sp.]